MDQNQEYNYLKLLIDVLINSHIARSGLSFVVFCSIIKLTTNG